MGCSPSKGKLFPGPEVLETQKEESVDFKHVNEDNTCLKSDKQDNELPRPIKEETPGVVEWSPMPPDTAVLQCPEGIKKTEVNMIPQEQSKHSEDTPVEKIKNMQRRRKNKGLEKRRRTEKQAKASIVQTKVDLPPHMVRAHQAAYAYLNPNISKYETLLGLLDQAAQTHLSLQPMMTALVLRFEEINQALEEMAEEGELMLKEHGDYMAWPSGMTGLPGMSAKPSTDTSKPSDPPPDLLQQLLQHTTEKMKLVGNSFQGLGDTTLVEAVEYFTSLSNLLADRLHAKQAAEGRLAQVLARVEKAAVKKTNPEDSALHSEDSGIGGENESLTGSERLRRHRGSAGSGSCGSGGNVRAAFDTLPNNLLNQVGLNEGEEEDEEDEDDEDDDDEDEDDEVERTGRKRSNSSPPDPSQPCPHMSYKYTQGQLPKRPLTAATSTTPEYSPSSNVLLELQMSQRDLDQRMKTMGGSWGERESTGPHYNLYRAGLRRHTLGGSRISRCAPKGPLKTNEIPSSLPALSPHPPGRQSVRRLINTFSQGVDGRPGQSLANIPPHIRRPRRSGTLLLPDIGNGDGALVTNGNNNNNSWPTDGRDDSDVDSLPPPPPEVLMDNSFQSTDDIAGDAEKAQDDSDRGRPVISQRTAVSQRLRASVQNVTVLPNRASVRQESIRQDAVRETQPGQDAEQHTETDLDLEKEKATTLYRQARKIIHLRNAAESPLKSNQDEQAGRGPSPLCAEGAARQGGIDPYEAEMSPCSLPVTAPPVSRVRLPPSCPSVHHRFPSPPTCRPQPVSGVPRPPSRPSSPRTWAKENNAEEVIPSVSFCNARSVFCQNVQQNSQTWTPSSSSVLPRPWGEPSRGRLLTRGMETNSRRTQSEQRPSLSTQVNGNESTAISNTERPSSPQMKEENAQSDPSTVATTA